MAAHLREGLPVDQILNAADEIGAGLIVVGRRGLGGVRRLLMGSVTEGLVHNAHYSVLVLRGEEDAWPSSRVGMADEPPTPPSPKDLRRRSHPGRDGLGDGEEDRRFFQDLPLLTEDFDLFTEPPEFLAFLGGKPLAFTLIDLCLLYPAPKGVVVRDSKLPGYLGGRFVCRADEANGLHFELWCVRRPGSSPAGVVIVKDPHDTFWGGYAGYFEDPNRHLWEVVWNPALELDE